MESPIESTSSILLLANKKKHNLRKKNERWRKKKAKRFILFVEDVRLLWRQQHLWECLEEDFGVILRSLGYLVMFF